jgi:hypothetical protein
MKVLIALIIAFVSGVVFADGVDFNTSSPYTHSNNPYTSSNNPYTSDNNRYSNDNNPYNQSSTRIIRDNSGQPIGYAVPKKDGGTNYFSYDSTERKGYQSGGSK